MEFKDIICPYCGNKMEKGKIQTWDSLYWTPIDERRNGISVYSKTKNSILLSNYSVLKLFGGAKIIAWYCRKCKVVIINNKK